VGNGRRFYKAPVGRAYVNGTYFQGKESVRETSADEGIYYAYCPACRRQTEHELDECVGCQDAELRRRRRVRKPRQDEPRH